MERYGYVKRRDGILVVVRHIATFDTEEDAKMMVELLNQEIKIQQ